MNVNIVEEKQTLETRAVDTRTSSGQEGEDIWVSLLRPVTSPERRYKHTLGGSIHAWHGGEAMLCDVRADEQITRRDARQLSLGPPPLYTLMLVCQGRLRYQDMHRDKCLLPGDVLVEDMAASRTLITENHRTLQLILPYSVSGLTLPNDLHGVVLRRHNIITRLLARHLLGLRKMTDRLSQNEFGTQVEVANQLLLAALPTDKRQRGEMSHLQRVIRREIERYIDRYLTSPELNAAHLGTVFKISRNQLYRLFRDSGGPSIYIRLRRLHVASQQIQAQRHRPEKWEYIAESLGFRSLKALDSALGEYLDSSLDLLSTSSDSLAILKKTDTVKALFHRLPGSEPRLN